MKILITPREHIWAEVTDQQLAAIYDAGATEVVVSTDGDQPVNLDGEIAATTPARFSVQPNAIDVVVPQHLTDVRRERE